jgi:hypothetical protein
MIPQVVASEQPESNDDTNIPSIAVQHSEPIGVSVPVGHVVSGDSFQTWRYFTELTQKAFACCYSPSISITILQ